MLPYYVHATAMRFERKGQMRQGDEADMAEIEIEKANFIPLLENGFRNTALC